MISNHSSSTRRSALFVDFDNVYLCLKNEDEQLADDFARQPDKLLRWLEGRELEGLDAEKSSPARSLLSRRCYLNPNSFSTYRPYYVRNAFDTVDCPPLTHRGKTGTDGHIMVDIMEMLSHPTQFDEFIILSGDADFIPVLLKLRIYDRRTTVIAMGNVSPALQAACDVFIDQDKVVKALFPEHAEDGDGGDQEEKVITAFIKNLVRNSDTPIRLAIVAQELRRKFPELSEDWLGNGSMKRFLQALDLSPIQIIDNDAGFLCDPSHHTCPDGLVLRTMAAGVEQITPEIKELAKRVNDITDTPLLGSDQYNQMMMCIAEEVNSNGYHLTLTSKNVRDRCKRLGVPVSRKDTNFILRSISFSGHRFVQGEENADTLAIALFRNTLRLCENAMLNLNQDEQRKLQSWLG